jgi:uncharacterized protein
VILEAIITTMNEDRSANISPMGVLVDPDITSLVLRPYKTTRTYHNLKRDGLGVVNITDDVELIARAAVGRLDKPPKLVVHKDTKAIILAQCCRWFVFKVLHVFDQTDRTTIECEITHRGNVRDFFGFNRAKHAVVEAAILATRIHLLKAEDIRFELQRLQPAIDKTAGDQERNAFEFLREYIELGIAQHHSKS